ncbi:tetratricopeptide-like helical domain-containing protein [Cavenderia fasciculata]|uniref:Tetratricopeptide-like helical domain-containing protein n=1 Tax=Cavenderia fasciculata TaxID=261658 RepID=F4PQJ7_CACFS|nr:tetratricopeptide-like helical domain-containing protein [Cavenderia fasciculata]EGG21164.1 tetratricopeptide-like helical domain-containing protein [Cavenderia fasciculata]|eukprot:XP_004359014.1 tetratricopeptide-like helical domain-containing protein [Cavenderia fasciculata]
MNMLHKSSRQWRCLATMTTTTTMTATTTIPSLSSLSLYSNCKSSSLLSSYSTSNNNNSSSSRDGSSSSSSFIPPSSSSSSFVPPPPPSSSSSASFIPPPPSSSSSSTSYVPPPPSSSHEPPPPPSSSSSTTETSKDSLYDTLDLSRPENIEQSTKEILDRIVISQESIHSKQEELNIKMITDTFFDKEDIKRVNSENAEKFEKAKDLYVFGVYDQAFALFSEIDVNHGMRNVFLGNMHLTGAGVPKNEALAFHHFNLATRARVPVAMGVVGEMYLKGQSVGLNESQARSYFDVAASLGLRSSTEQLIYMTINRVGGLFNLKKACFYLKRLAILGDTGAFATLGSLLYDIQRRLALDLWTFGCRIGNLDCLHYLGRYYYSNENPDYRNSFMLWTRAAEGGYAESQFCLGSMYEMGLTVDRNLPYSFHLYLSAATQGNADSQYLVGKAYNEGYGIEKNTVKAALWFQKAADQGDERAQEIVNTLNEKIQQRARSKLTTQSRYGKKISDQRASRNTFSKSRDKTVAPKLFTKLFRQQQPQNDSDNDKPRRTFKPRENDSDNDKPRRTFKPKENNNNSNDETVILDRKEGFGKKKKKD